MKSFRTTALLVGALVVLLFIDVLAHQMSFEAYETLPALPTIKSATAQQIRMTQGDSEIILKRQAEQSWQISAPFEDKADSPSIKRLLQPFLRPIVMDVRLAHGEHDTFGLQTPEVILIEIEGSEGPLTSFYLGRDAPDGSSYLRFPGEDVVYQARLGGRSRFAQPAAFWRNRDLVHFASDALRSLTLQTPSQTISFARTGATHPWTSPSIDPDQEELAALAESLSGLRGVGILPARFLPEDAKPLVVLTALTDTQQQTLSLFADGRGSIAQLPEHKNEIYRIKPGLLRLSSRPAAAWKNRQLFSIDPQNVISMSLIEENLTSTLLKNNKDGSWVMSEPENMDANQQEATWSANELASLRIDALYQGPEISFKVKSSITINTEQSSSVLEIGSAIEQPGLERLILLRAANEPDHLGAIRVERLKRLLQAWSR
jgi:hypothetical protein